MRHSKQFRRRNAVAAALIAAGAMCFGPTRRAMAWFDPIIFDPSAFAEHVQQVLELGEQISAAIQQVQNQTRQRAHLNSNVRVDDTGTVGGVQGQLDSGVYGTSTPAGQLNARYPANMSDVTWNQEQSDESAWTSRERQAVVENRRLQNQVYRDMAATRQQVESIVDASNAAPGETAAIQARNDLLAVASAELAKLQALRTARSRFKTEKLARRQSELSYAAAEQRRVRADWDNPAPATHVVVDPFQD